MRFTFIISILLFGQTLLAAPVLSGEEGVRSASIRIVDAETGEPIIGASVQLTCSSEVLYTDPDGMIDVSITDGEDCDLNISYVSYQDILIDSVELSENQEVQLKSQ